MRHAGLLLLVVATSCVESRAPVVGPVPVAGGRPLAIEVVDEAVSFPTTTEEGASFVVEPDGTIVVAASPPAGTPADGARIIALDARLARRWELPVPNKVSGMLPVGDATLVATRLESNAETQLQLVDHAGAVRTTATFQQLVGVQCSAGNRYWLAPERGGFIALVGCGSPRQLWWVHVAADLRSATHEGANGWNPIDARDWMSTPVLKDLTFVHLGQRYTLTQDIDYVARHTAHATTVGLDADLLVGATTVALREDTGVFSTRAFVTRLGARPWTTDLAPARDTSDPQHVASVAVAAEGSVLAAVHYGAEGRLLGARLPAPLRGDGTAMPRGVAVTELGAERGDVRAIVVPRPHAPWSFRFFVQVGASPQHLVIADEKQVTVFPRRGRPIPAVADGPVRGAPAVVAVAAVQAQTPLPEVWSELCGPHVLHKRNAPCRLEHVALGADGTVAAGGGYYESNQIGKRMLPKQAYETGLLVVHGPDGALRWQKVFGVSWHNDVSDVAVRDDGRVVVTGFHGQHFAIDGVRLPDRLVRKVEGQDMDFEAVSGFVAVFAPDGKLELLEDIDALAYGDRSTSTQRSCRGTLATQAADTTWLLASCPGAMFRIPLRGAVAGTPIAVGDLGGLSDSNWLLEPSGRVIGAHVGFDLSELVTGEGGRVTSVPVLADRAIGSLLAAGTSGAWTADSLNGGGLDAPVRLVATHTTPGLERTTALLLASAPRSRIDAVTVDDQGRPIFSIKAEGQPITIGGQVIAPVTLDPPSPVQARAFVRLTADGSRIDRVFVPALAPTECTRPSHGLMMSMVAKGDKLAVVFGFGVTPACGIKDEASTVMVFRTAP